MTRCPDCSATVVTATKYGLTVNLDPTPLDETAELAVLVGGGKTWTRHANGQAWRRTERHVRTMPAGSRAQYVEHAVHRCPVIATSQPLPHDEGQPGTRGTPGTPSPVEERT